MRICQFFISKKYIFTEINIFLILENHRPHSLQFDRLDILLVILHLQFEHVFVHTLAFGQTSGDTGPTLEDVCVVVHKWFRLAVVFVPPEHQVDFGRDVLVVHPPVVHDPVQVRLGPCLVRQQHFDTLLHRQRVDMVEHHAVVALHGGHAAILDLVHAVQADHGLLLLQHDGVALDVVDLVAV